MEISEGIESYLFKKRVAVARETEQLDDDNICRLQVLVSELLLKNELLRRQIRYDAVTFSKLQQLLEKGVSHAATGGDATHPVLQAYALLARQA